MILHDKNESTCLTLTGHSDLPRIIAAVKVKAPMESIPDGYIILKVVVKDLECNQSIHFYTPKEKENQSSCTTGERVHGVELGKYADSDQNKCKFKLSVSCQVENCNCEFQGFLAVENITGISAGICEIGLA